MSDAIITSEGSNALHDEDICRLVADWLEKYYPRHVWAVGANHEAGTVVIDLPYDRPVHLRQFAFMLHIPMILSMYGERQVMRAGGELLERFGLPRARRMEDAYERAAEHGLIDDHAIDKKNPPQ